MGHVGWVAGHRCWACPDLQQFLHWEVKEEEKASWTWRSCERMTTPDVRAETFCRSTVITTEVACLVSLESLLGLRYLATYLLGFFFSFFVIMRYLF